MDESILNEARGLISQRYADRRKEKGISQQKLADMTGLGVATIKRFEANKFWIGTKQLLILSHHLQMFFFVEEKDGNTPDAKWMRERWQRKGDKN